MTPDGTGHYVLPQAVPTAVIFLAAGVGLAAWAAVHLIKRQPRSPRLAATAFAGRTLLGLVALLAVAQAAMRAVVLAATWPLWLVALMAALGVEATAAIYRLERSTVSRRAGRILGALRAALVLAVAAMLAQPVLSWRRSRKLPRYVAVLVDDSVSMRIPGKELSGPERIRIAEALGIARRPLGLDKAVRRLQKVHMELQSRCDYLAMLGGADEKTRAAQLKACREDLHGSLSQARDGVSRHISELAGALAGQVKLPEQAGRQLAAVRLALAARVRKRLGEAADITGRKGPVSLAGHHGHLHKTIREAAGALAAANSTLAQNGERVDEAFYASLSRQRRADVDAVAEMTRYELARRLLCPAAPGHAGKGASRAGMLAAISRTHQVKLYTFAAGLTEVDVADWAVSVGKSTATTTSAPAKLPESQQRTLLAAALNKVMTEIPSEQLAGVIVLTDGRHNGPGRPQDVARRLGAMRVPICPVVVAGKRPPRDAAVASLEAPQTICAKDKLQVRADLKIDGLAGKNVRVSLLDGRTQVDSKTITVPANTWRTTVELADQPKEKGLKNYRVVVEKFDGEVFDGNNTFGLAVSVVSERAKLLLIEDRPRWEFRYLKNLFSGRDVSVKLQYVLAGPDRIAGRPPVAASASRPPDSRQASALPADQAEWMKFDAIILGDVKPVTLGAGATEALCKFVTDRGGTLIVLAGPCYMPHAFASTPLGMLLPVTVKASSEVLFGGNDKPFRIALTGEGAQSPILSQSSEPSENKKHWEAVPDLYWRHRLVATKPGATTLAYALEAGSPDYAGSAGRDHQSEKTVQMRRDFQRRNPLIVVQNVGLGKVMFLAFDRTWRMRYRTGDTYHHRFWGQVLRWATTGKLPAGTALARLGTDRGWYTPDSGILVRAKLLWPDLSPLVGRDVTVSVFSGRRRVLERKLRYLQGSPGMYTGDVGPLPAGTYRVKLFAPDISSALSEEDMEKLATEFSVQKTVPAEQVELSADESLLGRLAKLSGGRMAALADADSIIEGFGPATLTIERRRQSTLWDSWPALVLIVLLAGSEWLIRKKEGLA